MNEGILVILSGEYLPLFPNLIGWKTEQIDIHFILRYEFIEEETVCVCWKTANGHLPCLTLRVITSSFTAAYAQAVPSVRAAMRRVFISQQRSHYSFSFLNKMERKKKKAYHLAYHHV